jgi:predicted aldo/keto reductase-like oxidoreductase
MLGGQCVETDGFGKEILDYETYMTRMAQAKIVPCPSGIETPDNFRLYEALDKTSPSGTWYGQSR